MDTSTLDRDSTTPVGEGSDGKPNGVLLVALVGQRERSRILRILRREFSGLDASDLEDCFQLAWETALKQLPSEDASELAGFITVVARRRALDLCKRRGRTDVPLEYRLDGSGQERWDCHAPTPHEFAEAKEDAAVVRDLLARLKPRVRQVAALRWLEGLAPVEVQTRTGLSQKQYEGLVSRATRALEQQFLRLGSGQLCAEHSQELALAVGGELDEEALDHLKRHLEHCQCCRAAYRNSAIKLRNAAAFLPPLALATVDGGEALFRGASRAVAAVAAGIIVYGGVTGGDGGRRLPAKLGDEGGALALIAAAIDGGRQDDGPRPSHRGQSRRRSLEQSERGARSQSALKPTHAENDPPVAVAASPHVKGKGEFGGP